MSGVRPRCPEIGRSIPGKTLQPIRRPGVRGESGTQHVVGASPCGYFVVVVVVVWGFYGIL